LAANGFTADTSQLEAGMGFFAMYGSNSDLSAVSKRLAERWTLLHDGINVKKYPCCFNTHRTADAVLSLAPKLSGRVNDVRSIRLTLEPGGFDPLIHHRPTTGLEGKFSAEYVITAGLLDGLVDFRSFTDASVVRKEAQELIRKVEYAESETPAWGSSTYDYAYSVLEIELDDEVLRERVDVPKGDHTFPLTAGEIEAKFRSCLEFSGTDWDANEILAELNAIPSRANMDGFTSMRVDKTTDDRGEGSQEQVAGNGRSKTSSHDRS
jgi:2-methylcitrate dehydratase PrpD